MIYLPGYTRHMSEAQIMDKLTKIEEELSFIRDHIMDADLLITDDDLESIDEAQEDLEKGRTERIA